MSMNKGLENSRNSSYHQKRISGSYSPEGYNKLKESMKGKFQRNEKLIKKIQESQSSLHGAKKATQEMRNEQIIELERPYDCDENLEDKEHGIFQTPSKTSQDILSGVTSQIDQKQHILVEEELIEQQIEPFQNLDYIILQHMSSVETDQPDIRETKRSKDAQSSGSDGGQEDSSPIEKFNQKHQFMKLSNVRDLIDQEEQKQEFPEMEVASLSDLNSKLDDMTSCINDLKKKREARSQPAVGRNNQNRVIQNLEKEKMEFKFSMLGNQRESFGDINDFQDQKIQLQTSESIQHHSIPRDIHEEKNSIFRSKEPPEDSERTKNALQRIENDIRSRERPQEKTYYTDFLANPLYRLEATLEKNKQLKEQYQNQSSFRRDLDSFKKDAPEIVSTRQNDLLKITPIYSPKLETPCDPCTFRLENNKRMLYKKYLYENRESNSSFQFIDKYLDIDGQSVQSELKKPSQQSEENLHSFKQSEEKKQDQRYLNDQTNSQWQNEKIYLLNQKIEDQKFQIQLKDQVITKLENRIQSDKKMIEKFDMELGNLEKFKKDQEKKNANNEKMMEQQKVEVTKLRSENNQLKREKKEIQNDHLEEVESLKKLHKDIMKKAKEQNSQLINGSNQNRSMMMQGSEQMLSQQLREMTAVLEEFDEKYSRKEKQLEISRRQTDQIKESFESLKKLQNQTTMQLKKTEEDYLSLQQDCSQKLQKMASATQEKDQIFQELVDENQRLHLHVDNKDQLIKDQQQIIQELRNQLDEMQTEQDNQGQLMSRLKEKFANAQRDASQSRILSQENTRVSIERRQYISMERRVPNHQPPNYNTQKYAVAPQREVSPIYNKGEHSPAYNLAATRQEVVFTPPPPRQEEVYHQTQPRIEVPYQPRQEALQQLRQDFQSPPELAFNPCGPPIRQEGPLDTMSVLQRSQYFRREYEKSLERNGEYNLPLQRDHFQEHLRQDFQRGYDNHYTKQLQHQQSQSSLYRNDDQIKLEKINPNSLKHHESQTFGGNHSTASEPSLANGLHYTESCEQLNTGYDTQQHSEQQQPKVVKPSQIKVISPRQSQNPSPIKKKKSKVISLELLKNNSSQKELGLKSEFNPNHRDSKGDLRQKLLKMREFNNMNNYK